MSACEKMNIGILIYDGAEVLDFAGPFEVFSTAKCLCEYDWQVNLIASEPRPIEARGGFVVVPHMGINQVSALDVLVVVGGVHTQALQDALLLAWLKDMASKVPQVVSVCTGVFLLAQTGCLDGSRVTTHWEDMADLQHQYPMLTVLAGKRWVADGNYITSGGISAGIDMSLFLVSQWGGLALAERTAKQMEYRWHRN
ncbi:DJ-1/PfpI family protein [Snodgrassella sp. CFCC 13594]|uniref:DJ-1/PfpI family protein n=1 Tax=Snodgrassella sp. CFCC 13594 TaxID=1775559 RepID=UPI000A962770|nr:DJ-1/PfpI family protein [Snodgrassella sp. CFCC 13594]